ncbi:MAG: transposase [Actinomycetota bacterium]|nr:transposase [Actinomycetota bacterium]
MRARDPRRRRHFTAEVEKIFAEAAATDDAEDATFGTERAYEPPATLRGREDRRRRFAQAKTLLDAELAEERAAHEAHLAEQAAREAAEGRKLRGRKPKAPEDKAAHKEKKANTTDPESKVMSTPKGYLQGYNSEENFAALDEEHPDAYVATRNMKNNPAPRTGRRGPLRKDATLVEQMDRKVSKKAGRALYRRRQQLIEPVFGQIKDARGIRSFMRRGRAACDSEWKLICGTHNLSKLYRRARAEPSLTPFSWMAVGTTC